MIHLLPLAALLSFGGIAAVQDGTTIGFPRVRSEYPAIAGAIATGLDQSAVFRRLVETIDASDGLVYISEGTCYNGVQACLKLSVTISGPNRLLHVLVDSRKATGCRLIGSIGHELQHAIEGLSEVSIRSDFAIFNFFQRIGPTSAGRFETQLAVRTGLAVEREACRRNQSRVKTD